MDRLLLARARYVVAIAALVAGFFVFGLAAQAPAAAASGPVDGSITPAAGSLLTAPATADTGRIHVYDALVIARVCVRAVGTVDLAPAVLGDLWEGSASCFGEGSGISTTSSGSFVATEAASLADEGFINPSSIRFSQNSVSPNFSAGGSIDDLAAGLRNGSVSPADVPQIRIFESNGQWMTLDNRRLVAFQQAGVDVPYRLATAEEIAAQAWKVTTTNGGTSITIRGGGGSWPR